MSGMAGVEVTVMVVGMTTRLFSESRPWKNAADGRVEEFEARNRIGDGVKRRGSGSEGDDIAD